MKKILIDSCIVIDYIKEVPEIVKEIDNISMSCINCIVEMELMQGARNKNDLIFIKKKLEKFWLLPMHDEVAKLSSKLIDMFSLSHNLQIPDALIASTALVYDLPLFTHNHKDFKYIPNLKFYQYND